MSVPVPDATGDQAGAGTWRTAAEDGQEYIYAKCHAGHDFKAPRKGIGRANAAAWASRHQRCRGEVSS